jgi:hypothetical protein
MKNKIYIQIICFVIATFLYSVSEAQIFINELDSDTPGIDDKEFVEIRTIAPFTSLAGHVLVFFNGNPASSNANQSYYAIDLNSLTTDTNGIVTIGNVGLSPAPNMIFPDNIIQNGADALAIYAGTLADFPDGTFATSTNLVHALAYDTSDPDALALMALLGITAPQMDENENNLQATESIQRKNNGTFEVKAPTPGAMNDGSGFVYNGLTILANTANKNEGDTMHISITTQTNVATATNFNIGLSNGNFNTSDYTGLLAVNIPAGSSSFNTVITITDDLIDEGDEVLKIKFGVLPFGLNRLNDNVETRVVDNDFTIDPWGTPLNPTYGVVLSSAPANYYNSLNGLAGNALKIALQNIIADSTIVRAHNYGDITSILMQADHNPKNSNQVWLMYVEEPRAKLDFQTTSSGTGKWNREHIYPQSRGGFANGTDDVPDGPNVYLTTNANDILAGHADAHHIRAEDALENSIRNNKDYGGTDYNGPSGTANSWRGDVSRALFYMAIRYNALQVVSGNLSDSTNGKIGDLDSLLSWNKSDPRDDFEMYRNNYIYDNWQKNRNPFIDLPELADYLWGTKVGDTWVGSLGVKTFTSNSVRLYPNPAVNSFTIDGLEGNGSLYLYNIKGELVMQKQFVSKTIQNVGLPSGIYVLKIVSESGTYAKELLLK